MGNSNKEDLSTQYFLKFVSEGLKEGNDYVKNYLSVSILDDITYYHSLDMIIGWVVMGCHSPKYRSSSYEHIPLLSNHGTIVVCDHFMYHTFSKLRIPL